MKIWINNEGVFAGLIRNRMKEKRKNVAIDF